MYSLFPKMDVLRFQPEKIKFSDAFDSDIEDETSTMDSNVSRNLKRRSVIMERLQKTKKGKLDIFLKVFNFGFRSDY